MAKVVSKKTVQEKKAPVKKVPAFKVKDEVVVFDKKAEEYYYGVVTEVGDKIKVKHDDKTIGVYTKENVFNKKDFEAQEDVSTESDDADVDIDLDEDIDSAIVNDEADEDTEIVEEESEDEDEKINEDDEEVSEDDDTVVTDEDDEKENVSSDAWFAVGDEHDADFKGPQQQTFRVWMPQNCKSRPFTIITPQPFTFKEHAVKMGGTFRNYFTCIAPLGQRCPLCENKSRPAVMKAFYVIDHTPYKNKQGKEMKDQVRLLVMKQNSYKIFRTQVDEFFEEKGKEVNWLGLHFTAKRTDADKSPGTGDIFNIKGNVKVDSKTKKAIEDIQKEFVPLTRKAMLQQINFIEPTESGEEE